ncbi:MAG: sulfur carrier protein ThiS [Streptosporangiales bacterium]
MTIELNGETRELADGTTLATLMEQLTGSTRGCAAVVDGEIAPRSEWASRRLRTGQSVEIITAVQGG